MGDVNLEMALRLSDRLGGHLMTGHVDGVGIVTRFEAVAGDAGGSWFLEIEAPAELARFIATKGSIAVTFRRKGAGFFRHIGASNRRGERTSLRG